MMDNMSILTIRLMKYDFRVDVCPAHPQSWAVILYSPQSTVGKFKIDHYEQTWMYRWIDIRAGIMNIRIRGPRCS